MGSQVSSEVKLLVQIATDVGAVRAAVEALDEKMDGHATDDKVIHADHESRLRSVETGRNRLLGALAVVAPLAGAGGAYLFKMFGGS